MIGERRLGGTTFPERKQLPKAAIAGLDLPRTGINHASELVAYFLEAPARIQSTQDAYNEAKQAADGRKAEVIVDVLMRFDGIKSNEETRKASIQQALSTDGQYINLLLAEMAAESVYTRAKNEFVAAQIVATILG